MANYWICSVNRQNFDKVVQHNVWGVKDHFKGNLQKTEEGDHLLFYIYRGQTIGGEFQVKKGPYRDSKVIFSGGSFPNRVGIAPVILPKKPLPFSPELRAKLQFITNKAHWSGHLRQAMRTIPEADYKLIIAELEKQE